MERTSSEEGMLRANGTISIQNASKLGGTWAIVISVKLVVMFIKFAIWAKIWCSAVLWWYLMSVVWAAFGLNNRSFMRKRSFIFLLSRDCIGANKSCGFSSFQLEPKAQLSLPRQLPYCFVRVTSWVLTFWYSEKLGKLVFQGFFTKTH